MSLSKQEAKEARKRALAYEANMAIEGLSIAPEDRAFIDQLDADGVGYEEGIEKLTQYFIDQGLIPQKEAALAAE